jgi:hypothetical protein
MLAVAGSGYGLIGILGDHPVGRSDFLLRPARVSAP